MAEKYRPPIAEAVAQIAEALKIPNDQVIYQMGHDSALHQGDGYLENFDVDLKSAIKAIDGD